MPDRHLIDVHVLLLRGTELLLTKRRGGAFDGRWHLPSGKLDTGEDVLTDGGYRYHYAYAYTSS